MRFTRATFAALTAVVLLACVPPQTLTAASWRRLEVAPLPMATPLVYLVATCNVREFAYDVRYAGWYALLANYNGVEGIFGGTAVWRQAGERVVNYMELPFIPFRVGWSANSAEPWHTASNTVTGWNHCL